MDNKVVLVTIIFFATIFTLFPKSRNQKFEQSKGQKIKKLYTAE